VNFGLLTPEITWLMFTHPNRLFRKGIFRLPESAAPQIFTRGKEWPTLTSAPPPGTRTPFTIFFKDRSKIGLKCSLLAARTLEPGGILHDTLSRDVLLDGGYNASATFGGHCPFKIWEGKKRPKFSTFYGNFRVWLQISLERIEISTSGKKLYQVLLIAHWIKEIWRTLVH